MLLFQRTETVIFYGVLNNFYLNIFKIQICTKHCKIIFKRAKLLTKFQIIFVSLNNESFNLHTSIAKIFKTINTNKYITTNPALMLGWFFVGVGLDGSVEIWRNWGEKFGAAEHEHLLQGLPASELKIKNMEKVCKIHH